MVWLTSVQADGRSFLKFTLQFHQVCAKLKGRMMQAGTIMVGYQPDDRRPNFFRNIISSAAVTKTDVDFLLSEIDRLGQDIIVD